LASREISSQVESIEQIDEDTKDRLVVELLQQVSELKQARRDAEQFQPGQSPSAERLRLVSLCLDKADKLFDKIKFIGNTATGIAERVVPIVAKTLPILASARNLIGIP